LISANKKMDDLMFACLSLGYSQVSSLSALKGHHNESKRTTWF